MREASEPIKKDKYGIDIYKAVRVGSRGVKFELELRDNITLIKDDSGTGKTLLANIIQDTINQEEREEGSSRYYLVKSIENLKTIKHLKDKVIIIDEADLILDKESVEHINRDHDNYYIIMARNTLGLEGTLNAIGKLVREGRDIHIEYKYNEFGW